MTFKLLLTILIVSTVSAFDCPKGFLCGSGCGLHESEADAMARAQIGKMFKTRVTSKFASIRSSIGELDESYVYEAIYENVVENLEGVIIEKREDEDGEVCALAILNKTLFSERIKSKISKYTDENKKLKSSGKRLVWEKIRVNNYEIAHLGSLLSAVDLDTVSKVTTPPNFTLYPVVLTYNLDDDLLDFKKLIESRMLRNGVVQGKKSKRSMTIKLDIEKAALNVSGFERYTLNYDLVSKLGTKTTGRAYGKMTTHARSRSKVLEKLFKQMEEKISEIFIDTGI